jgi:uncharacterized DUF497 family protein
MSENDPIFEFSAPAEFEWDQNKSDANLIKHGIDFEDASEVFYGPVVVRRSNRNNEERWIAIGKSNDRYVSVIFTRRNEVIRIISARHSRTDEKRAYSSASMGGSAQRKD